MGCDAGGLLWVMLVSRAGAGWFLTALPSPASARTNLHHSHPASTSTRPKKVRLGEKEALDGLLGWLEARQGGLRGLEYYQERRLKRLGLMDDEGRTTYDSFFKVGYLFFGGEGVVSACLCVCVGWGVVPALCSESHLSPAFLCFSLSRTASPKSPALWMAMSCYVNMGLPPTAVLGCKPLQLQTPLHQATTQLTVDSRSVINHSRPSQQHSQSAKARLQQNSTDRSG